MSTPLSAHDIRAAAEVHRELGPEYSDAVVDSFFEKVDKEIQSRIDARLAEIATARSRRPTAVSSGRRRDLLRGMAIGCGVAGLPFTLMLLIRDPYGSFSARQVLAAWAITVIVYVVIFAFLSQKPNGSD